MLFFLFFSGISNPDLLLNITRICFGVGVLASYSLLFSVYMLNSGKNTLSKIKIFLFFVFYVLVFGIYGFTDLIIEGLYFSNNIYREIPGKMFFIHFLLQIVFALSFIGMSFLKVKNQSYINKLRLRYILLLSYFIIFLVILLQLVLPIFEIWFLEKELILFFLLYVLSVVYVIKRYYFTSIYYSLGKVVILGLSIFCSASTIVILNYLHINVNSGFWGMPIPLLYGNVIIGILFHVLYYKILGNIFLGKSIKDDLEKTMKKLKYNISSITDFHHLNNYLAGEFGKIFKTQFFKLQLYKDGYPELKKYFEKDYKYFINDFVFIEENKSKFNKNTILKNIDEEGFLIFPIYHNRDNIGILMIGKKAFGDFYTKLEIELIQDFIFFIEHHLKYIQSFEKIRDLSLNLDTKVDEKTIEYNNLINKQKEFIAMISHEIRSPVASAIFQADSMLDDMKNGEVENMKSELDILNSILIKIGDLTSKLFAVQYYDTNNIELYLEQIHITHLLKNEIEIHTHIHEHIEFIDRVDKNIGFLKIDKIQFGQVIENLIGNAVKFTHGKDGIVCMTAYKTQDSLVVSIEDNGEGFEGIEIGELFDKYTKGSGNSIGLGMGLYLCKKIISMHDGVIQAGFSKEFSGAQFTITIPIKNSTLM
ncbi:MAG: ATP-binding protein [Candidatus Altimarinota bacterium]